MTMEEYRSLLQHQRRDTVIFFGEGRAVVGKTYTAVYAKEIENR